MFQRKKPPSYFWFLALTTIPQLLVCSMWAERRKKNTKTVNPLVFSKELKM